MSTSVAATGAITVNVTNTSLIMRLKDKLRLVSGATTDPVTPRGGVYITSSSAGGAYQDLLPTASAATGTLQVLINPGGGCIPRSGQAGYDFVNQTQKTVTLTAANATNPRIDRISARIYDPAQGDSPPAPLTAAGGVLFEVTDGTPAGSPSAPALPANSIAIATVLVPANAVNSASLTVTDVRVSTGLPFAPRPVLPGESFTSLKGASTPTGFLVGERLQSSFGDYWWNGTTWQPVSSFIALGYTPTFTFATGTLGTGFTSVGRFFYMGNMVFVTASLTAGTGVSLDVGTISVTMPGTSLNGGAAVKWTGTAIWGGGAGYFGYAALDSNSSTAIVYAIKRQAGTAGGGANPALSSGAIDTPGNSGIVFTAGNTLTVNIAFEVG